MNKKKCKIHATSPITCFTVPIIGHTELNLTNDEIYKCLCSNAIVEEVLSNGKLITLDFTNYDKNNYIEEKPPVVIEKHEEVITLTDKVEIKENISTEEVKQVEEQPIIEEKQESPVKTHEVASRNNRQKYSSNKKGKNKR